eukprot:m.318174 g.318174  ORF g.318174 m.318174 type:complete len:1036 (+) comp19697_c0_seq10:540-3647(+)
MQPAATPGDGKERPETVRRHKTHQHARSLSDGGPVTSSPTLEEAGANKRLSYTDSGSGGEEGVHGGGGGSAGGGAGSNDSSSARIPPDRHLSADATLSGSRSQGTTPTPRESLPRRVRKRIRPPAGQKADLSQCVDGAFSTFARKQASLSANQPARLPSPVPDDQERKRPLQRATCELKELYRDCNVEFRYDNSVVTRRVLTNPSSPVANDGYDNTKGDYILRAREQIGEDDNVYTIVGMLGRGTFGQVVKCKRERDGAMVAVKIVKNIPEYHSQSLVEIEMLRRLADLHGHSQRRLVGMLGHFVFRNHLCMVFELLSVSLYDLLKQNKFRGLSVGRVRLFCFQLLDALCAMQDASVVHCDLKPENVLMENVGQGHRSSGFVKVIDFGSACLLGKQMHSYIQSRFYRAPEILVGAGLSHAIDMWSFGCLAAELCLGLPLFPGTSEFDQLAQIVQFFGPLPRNVLQVGKKTSQFYHETTDEAGVTVYQLKSYEQYSQERGRAEKPGKSVNTRFGISSLQSLAAVAAKWDPQAAEDLECFAHFLSGVLAMDPSARWTAHQAITHPFITREQFSRRWQPDANGRSSPSGVSSPVPGAMATGAARPVLPRKKSGSRLNSSQSPRASPPQHNPLAAALAVGAASFHQAMDNMHISQPPPHMALAPQPQQPTQGPPSPQQPRQQMGMSPPQQQMRYFRNMPNPHQAVNFVPPPPHATMSVRPPMQAAAQQAQQAQAGAFRPWLGQPTVGPPVADPRRHMSSEDRRFLQGRSRSRSLDKVGRRSPQTPRGRRSSRSPPMSPSADTGESAQPHFFGATGGGAGGPAPAGSNGGMAGDEMGVAMTGGAPSDGCGSNGSMPPAAPAFYPVPHAGGLQHAVPMHTSPVLAGFFGGDPRDFLVDPTGTPMAYPRLAEPLVYPVVGTPTGWVFSPAGTPAGTPFSPAPPVLRSSPVVPRYSPGTGPSRYSPGTGPSRYSPGTGPPPPGYVPLGYQSGRPPAYRQQTPPYGLGSRQQPSPPIGGHQPKRQMTPPRHGPPSPTTGTPGPG